MKNERDFVVDRVMLVDDSRIDNFVNQKVLERGNFSREIVVFTRAKRALEYLSSPDQNPLPDLILLDAVLPEMDGFGFMRAFRELPESTRNHCQIVMLTNLNPGHVMKGMVSVPEIDHWMQKPLMLSNLEVLRRIYEVPVKASAG